MGWIANLLRFYQSPTTYKEVGAGQGAQLGKFSPSFSVTVDIDSPSTGGGVMIWGYSDVWTGCKGGSGFEFALSPSKLKVVGIKGKPFPDQRFSIPWWGSTYSAELKFLVDRMEVHFTTHGADPGIRMQVLEDMPESLWLGVGRPPAPLQGFAGARYRNIKVRPW